MSGESRDSPMHAGKIQPPSAQPCSKRSLSYDGSQHKDLAALIDEAAGGQRPDHHLRPEDRITGDSLLTELATAKQRNRELQQKVEVLEGRLGAQGPSLGPALLDQHPLVIGLRGRLAEVELDIVEKDRTIASLRDDVEVLRETNRSVREYGLTGG
jgi:hypothetical protein